VQRHLDRGMAFEGGDHGLVGQAVHLFEDPAEVADRLVVMKYEGQRDAATRFVRRAPLPQVGLRTWNDPIAIGRRATQLCERLK
jgi:hypothetical protein